MQTQKILVAYATNAGTTADVARMVADELGLKGVEVEVRQIEEVTSVEPYGAVILGAPMILGWHRGAVKFLKQHTEALSRRPVAYFITAMRLTDMGETTVDGVPISVDPALSRPPQKSGHLSIKERYATVTRYLRPVLRATPSVRPLSVGFFGGKLELFRLKWWQALFVMLVIQAQPGGSHNKPFIREWAANLYPALTGEASQEPFVQS
jgi:menaquinone-dependent protoporphyrinogen IX oxidase